MTRLSPIGASHEFRAISWLIACLLLSGCGRLGFSTDDVTQAGARPDSDDRDEDGDVDEPPRGSSDDDDEQTPDRDAGQPTDGQDASAADPEPDDAGTVTPGVDGGDTPSLDGGIDIVDGGANGSDAGSRPRGPGLLDCGERNSKSTLLCAAFDRDFPERSSTRSNNGSIRVEQGELEAKTSREEGSAALDVKFEAQNAGDLYLSAWIRIPDDFELSAVNIIGLQATTGNDPSVDINLNAPGALEVFAAQDNTTKRAPDFVVPRDRWLCLKARILLNSAAGEIDLSIEGTDVFAIRNVDTLPSVGVDQLAIGFDWTGSTQAPASIFFDNVILSNQPFSGDCP